MPLPLNSEEKQTFTGPDDKKLPRNILAMSEPKRIAYVEAWNKAYESCIKKDTPEAFCVNLANRAAEAVVKEDGIERFFNPFKRS